MNVYDHATSLLEKMGNRHLALDVAWFQKKENSYSFAKLSFWQDVERVLQGSHPLKVEHVSTCRDCGEETILGSNFCGVACGARYHGEDQ